MAECDPNATRRVPLEFDDDGTPMFNSVCSPDNFKARALCVTPPRHVIPVIFVPGIMGSNLKASKTAKKPGAKSWQPPNGIREGLGEVRIRADQSPADRQTQLNPNGVEVDDSGTVEIPSTLYTLTEKEARRRGWGEIHWGGYGKMLKVLEEALNDQYEACGTKYAQSMPVWKLAQDIKQKTHEKHWGSKGDARNITKDEFLRLDDYYYPVHACGYNWMESNEKAAERLIKRIEAIIAWYQNNGYFVPEGRVILVSHSMGGLVTRRAAQLDQEKTPEQRKILGIVHGEQPVLGAPVVYRRFRAGTENDGFFDVVGKLSAIVLGWDAADVTCVLAHSPGALELLPTKDYEPGWLKIMNGDNVLESLPKGEVINGIGTKPDPYSEVYATRAQDVWWGMIDETLIDPAGMVEDKSPFDAYMAALTKAKEFHDTLGLYFHPNTYAHFGAEPEKKNSFHTVRWEGECRFLRGRPKLNGEHTEDLMQAKAQSWTKRGQCTLEFKGEQMDFKLAGKDGGGDATVPEPSGAIVEKSGLKATFRMQGFAHAESYNDRHVQDNTVYCIGRIVQDAKPVSQLPQKGKPCLSDESTTGHTEEESSDDYSDESYSLSASSQQPDTRTGAA